MRIIDLTNGLNQGRHNHHCFNGSLVHYHDNWYIFVYRIAKYNISMVCHPWKIWDNGYKKFSNPKSIMLRKYRSYFGKSSTIEISDKNLIMPVEEFDSTGLAFYTYESGEFMLQHNINNLFGKEVNQDARIILLGSSYYLTYNTFEKADQQTYIVMRFRKMNVTPAQIILSDEYELFPRRRIIDKNSTLDLKGNVMYEINSHFVILKEGREIRTPIPQLEKLIHHYGANNVFVSVGTPPIRYNEHYLMVGHIKITYKKIATVYPFNKFMETIHFEHVTRHGQFIYFMFFLLFDDNYNVIKLSNPFIPHLDMQHLPFLLVFPMGLTYLDNNPDTKIAISYGEGDCRCKVLVLSQSEVDSLLVDDLTNGFYFLTNHKSILHYGYFNHMNCGDDAFKDVFDYLHQMYYPHFSIKYVEPEDTIPRSDLATVGGGDVINPYFLEKVRRVTDTMLAVGVGIPYTDNFHYFKLFKKTILRNSRDYEQLKFTYNVTYFPDLTFLLPKLFQIPRYDHTGDNIGISLARTYYHRRYKTEYQDFVTNVIVFINKLLCHNFKIHLIPFCIETRSVTENDMLILHDVKKQIPHTNLTIFEPRVDDTGPSYVKQIYQKIAQMDFNICTRFHAHIFSTIHAVPFISLSCSRKCSEYMYSIDLINNLYKLETNQDDLPINFNGDLFYQFVLDKIADAKACTKKLKTCAKKYAVLMDRFEVYWRNLVYKHLPGTEQIQLFPKIGTNIPIVKPQVINETVDKAPIVPNSNNDILTGQHPWPTEQLDKPKPLDQPREQINRSEQLNTTQTKPMEPVIIQTVEVPRIQTIEVPRIETVEVPRIQTVEVPRIQTVEVPRIQTVEVPRIQIVEVPRIQTIEVPRMQTVEVPRMQTVEVPRIQTVEVPRTQTVEVPRMQTVEVPRIQTVEVPRMQTVEVPRIQTVEVPRMQTVEVPRIQTVEVPRIQTVEVPRMQTVEVPQYRTVEVPRMQTVEVPRIQTVEVPQYRTVEVPRMQTVEVPRMQTVEVPRMQTVEVPRMQTVEVPLYKTIMIPQYKTVEMSQMQMIDVPQIRTVEIPVKVPQYNIIEVPQYKTVEVSQIRTTAMPQYRIVDVPRIHTIEVLQNRTIEMPQYRTVEVPRMQTVEVPQYRTVEIPQMQTVEIPQCKQ